MNDTDAPIVRFAALPESDLVPGTVYEGGAKGHQGDDPLAPLLGVGNAGGIRRLGREHAHYVALFTTQAESEWPDHFERDGQVFVYYGDQRNPGRDVFDTPRGGNRLLDEVFARAALDDMDIRSRIPPFFLFSKTGRGRDVLFDGLLVPGSGLVSPSEQLRVEAHETPNGVFKNLRATFSVLRPRVIPRGWLEDLRAGDSLTDNAPPEWFKWVAIGN